MVVIETREQPLVFLTPVPSHNGVNDIMRRNYRDDNDQQIKDGRDKQMIIPTHKS